MGTLSAGDALYPLMNVRWCLVPVLALALFASFACGGSKKAPATETPAASPTAEATPATSPTAAPTATPTPEIINGVTVGTMTAGVPVDLPKGVVLYVASACQACDVPATALERVWRDLGGTVHTDRLYQQDATKGYIASMAVSPGGSNIIIGVCTAGNCGPMGVMTADAKTTFQGSKDGGISWTEIGSVGGYAWIMTSYEGPNLGGVAKHIHGPAGVGVEQTWDYISVPSNEVIPNSLTLEPRTLTFALGSNVVYRGPDHTSLWNIQGGSNPWLAPKLPPTGDVQAAIQFNGESAYSWAVRWLQDGPGTPKGYVGFMDAREQTPARILRVLPDGPGIQWMGGLADAKSLVVNAYMPGSALGVAPAPQGFTMVPAILDIDTGQLHAIKELVARAITPTATSVGDSTRVLASARGHFVAVKGAGDCLNVRAQPSKSAQVLGCLKDGVLLKSLAQSTVADGVTWANVEMLGGAAGWASLEFLDLGAAGLTVTATQPADARSGDAAVDRVLDALASGDRARIIALMEWTIIGCLTEPMGIGSPPKCPDDVPNGTKVETLPGACAEGYYILKDSLTTNTDFSLFKPTPLYAVWREKVVNAEWSSHDTVALYGTPGGFTTAVFLNEGRITGFSGCRLNPAEDISKVPATNFLIRPR